MTPGYRLIKIKMILDEKNLMIKDVDKNILEIMTWFFLCFFFLNYLTGTKLQAFETVEKKKEFSVLFVVVC